MRAYVFTDKALARLAGRFVWLEVNTELEKNAPFLDKHPVDVWPTLLVIDPRTEQPLLKYFGALKVPGLEKLLDDGERAFRGKGTGLDAELAQADRLYADKKLTDAATALDNLLSKSPKDWPERGRAAEMLVFALSQLDRTRECMERAQTIGPQLPASLSRANVVSTGLSCALQTPPQTPRRGEALVTLEKETQASLDPSIDMAADDRSGLYQALVEARNEAKDTAGAETYAKQWATFLDGEAARAKTPEARAVFNYHRLLAYQALHQTERTLPFLEQSSKELPHEYDPPYRLAAAYLELKRYDEALAANARALANVYGPRKLNVLRQRADILAAKGDSPGAIKLLREALKDFDQLPASQRSAAQRTTIEKKLAALGAK